MIASPSVSGSPVSWRENPLPRSRITGQPNFCSYESALRGSEKSSYLTAGLSNDCTQLYCQNETEVCVVEIGNASSPPIFRTVFYFKLVKKLSHRIDPKGTMTIAQQNKYETIRRAALSDRFLIIATTYRLLIIITASGILFDTKVHGDWENSALAIYEKEIYLIIVLGQHRRNSNGQREGQIKFLTYVNGDRSENSLTVLSRAFPESEPDFPRKLVFSTDGSLLLCVTKLLNKILIWRVGEQFASLDNLYGFRRNGFASVRISGSHPLSVTDSSNTGNAAYRYSLGFNLQFTFESCICHLYDLSIIRTL